MKSSEQRRISTIVVAVTLFSSIAALCDVVYSQAHGKTRLPLDVISLWIGIPLFWASTNNPKWRIGASGAMLYRELSYIIGLDVLSMLHLFCAGLCLLIIQQTLVVAQGKDSALLPGTVLFANDALWRERNDAISAGMLLLFGLFFFVSGVINRSSGCLFLNDIVGGPVFWFVKSMQLLAKDALKWTTTDRLLLYGMLAQCNILFAEMIILLPLNKAMLDVEYSWGHLMLLLTCNAIASAPLIL